jgi:uncharacterized membrane protein YtjA (UPF0391 family)
MLHYAMSFVIARSPRAIWFYGIAAGATSIAQTLFIVLAVIGFLISLFRRG